MSKFANLPDRFARIFEALSANDFSSALTLICPLIDSAGKEMYRIKKTGERFKRVLRENNDFLYWTITGGLFVLKKDTQFQFLREGKPPTDLPQSIYKMVRNSLIHEAEISTEFEFNDGGELGPREGRITFPKDLVWALALMLTYLPCYQDCCPHGYPLTLSGHRVNLTECWGDRQKLEAILRRVFGRDEPKNSKG